MKSLSGSQPRRSWDSAKLVNGLMTTSFRHHIHWFSLELRTWGGGFELCPLLGLIIDWINGLEWPRQRPTCRDYGSPERKGFTIREGSGDGASPSSREDGMLEGMCSSRYVCPDPVNLEIHHPEKPYTYSKTEHLPLLKIFNKPRHHLQSPLSVHNGKKPFFQEEQAWNKNDKLFRAVSNWGSWIKTIIFWVKNHVFLYPWGCTWRRPSRHAAGVIAASGGRASFSAHSPLHVFYIIICLIGK